jgi:hypothetical protein
MDKPLNSRERTCPLQGGATNVIITQHVLIGQNKNKNIQIVKPKYHLQYY